MVALDRDCQYRRTALALALAALGVVGEASCVSNPYYMAPEGDTESLTDPSGDASTSADPTDTTDATTDATTGMTTGMTTGVTTGDPGTVTDATSTTGVSTTEPVTSSTTDPDESESEGDCQAIEDIEITIDEDAFFIDNGEIPCIYPEWGNNLEHRCSYLNFGSTDKAPIANIKIPGATLRSTLALRPNLDELTAAISQGELVEAWIKVTVSGTPLQDTSLEMHAIHPEDKWYAGTQQGTIPAALESTYRLLTQMPPKSWISNDGPTGASTPICKVDLGIKNYQEHPLHLCEIPLKDHILKVLKEDIPFHGLVVFTNSIGGGGDEFYTYASEAQDPELKPKMVVKVCTQ